MASLLQYFGVGPGKAAVEAHKERTGSETVRSLPAAWYTDKEMYQLERRAIFSKRWLFITASSRLPGPGDFLRYTIAGYDIILVKDRTNTINAFHNICRHRAYQVVEEESGHKNILSCRYHGWSYGLNGKLAKAPAYEECVDFDKSKNGLFKIHTHVDSKGFVWINLDGNESPEIPWEQEFETVDEQERFSKFNFEDYKLDHVYTMEGDYNWKIASDNFNECYHCKTTHPDVPTFLTIDSHHVDVEKGHMQHDHASTPEQKAKGYDVNSTYYFPNVSMSVAPHFMMIQKFLPQGPKKSIMHYEVYRNVKSSEEDFKLIADTYARVMGEDKVLCDRAQRNINAGVYVNGELHPRWEKGPLYIQQAVRQVIVEHFNKEKAAGHQIWPARQKIKAGNGSGEGKTTDEDMEICRALNCGSQPQPQLAW